MREAKGIIGGALFALSAMMIMAGLIPPATDAWVIIEVIHPFKYYLLMGILCVVGISLIVIDFRTKE